VEAGLPVDPAWVAFMVETLRPGSVRPVGGIVGGRGWAVGAGEPWGFGPARAVPPAVVYLIGGGPKGRTLRPKVDSMMSPAA